MTKMQVLAPAKVNLLLRVLGKRDDGFHEIETFMAPVSLSDRIEIERQQRWIDFTCDDPTVPKGDENLVMRAAKLFFESTQCKGGVSIVLHKKIPHGAGLGGGSSDAASTLLALNQLFEINLPREALAKMAETLGSDVPFFIFGSAAICKGRGELVLAKPLQKKLRLLLLKPPFGVPTAWAYGRWERSKELPEVGIQEFDGKTFVNDLERPVFEKFVFLAELKNWLRKQPEVGVALMSGSGSTVFAVIKSGSGADVLPDRARRELDPELWTCACETLEGAAL